MAIPPQTYADLKYQQAQASRAIPPQWLRGIGVAVDGEPFLTIRIAPGHKTDVVRRLWHAGIRGPFEVVEMEMARPRSRNPELTEPVAPYRYPVLDRPIPEQQLVDELGELLERGGVLRSGPTASVWLWNPLDVEHAKNPRRYAQVIPDERRFEFARATLYLPACHRLGLLAHEVGHVLDPIGGEDDADAAAARHLGVQIGYDRRWPGKGLQVARNCP